MSGSRAASKAAMASSITILETIEQDGGEDAPLLNREGLSAQAKSPQEAYSGTIPASLDWQFLSSLSRLLHFLRPYAAVLLSTLAVLEILIFAQVGKITGNYYRCLLEKDWGAFRRITALSAMLYAAATLTRSTNSWLSQMLALRWRNALTGDLQQRYLTNTAFHKVEQRCDNPDQRMVQDTNLFCIILAEMVQRLAATPFKIVFYSVWMGSITSWPALLAVYSFFVIGASIQRGLISPIAALVCQQELLEGNLRFAHMRIRSGREQIAMWGGSAAELAHVQKQLAAAVANQQRVIMWRWLLNGVTIAIDYTGAVLSFACVALPIAAGVFGKAEDTGETAQKISNASFATLSLIYSFTEMLDLSDKLSSLAGLTARIAHLQQAFAAIHVSEKQPHFPGASTVLAAPEVMSTVDGTRWQLSIHSLSRRMSEQAYECFIQAPRHSRLLVACTIQGEQRMQVEEEDRMAAMLVNFTRWQAAVVAFCRERGFWSDASDPRSGFSLHGPRARRWNEVRAMHTLLGYAVEDEESICPLLVHPEFGTTAYPATLITNAPLPVLQEAIQKAEVACGMLRGRRSASTNRMTTTTVRATSRQDADEWQLLDQPSSSSSEPVLVIEGLSCMSGQQRAIVRDLSLTLGPGERLLIVGMSGVGKTTLLKALRGLWPCKAAWIDMPTQVCFASQRLLAAPGNTLREQLIYPSTKPVTSEQLWALLHAVQLDHLLMRVQGDWEKPHGWQGGYSKPYLLLQLDSDSGELSQGELQRLAFARLLYMQPSLAVLDEPVSAMSATQGKLLLKQLGDAGIAVLCTGQLSCPVVDYFPTVIALQGDSLGSWQCQRHSGS